MRSIPAILLASLAIVGQSQMAFSKQPLSKGEWTYKNGKPESVTFVYGTALTVKEIDQLSSHTSLTRIVMGYAGVDSECVEIEGDTGRLGRLKNLEKVHLCVDGMNDDDLRFIALLPKLQTLEFNADNGYDSAPICTDRCADHLRSAKTLRSLVIHDGRFTDKFVAKITEGLPNLEELSLSSPALRKWNNSKEISKLLGTWEYVSATYEGKPIDLGKNELMMALALSSVRRAQRATIMQIDRRAHEQQIHSGKKCDQCNVKRSIQTQQRFPLS